MASKQGFRLSAQRRRIETNVLTGSIYAFWICAGGWQWSWGKAKTWRRSMDGSKRPEMHSTRSTTRKKGCTSVKTSSQASWWQPRRLRAFCLCSRASHRPRRPRIWPGPWRDGWTAWSTAYPAATRRLPILSRCDIGADLCGRSSTGWSQTAYVPMGLRILRAV